MAPPLIAPPLFPSRESSEADPPVPHQDPQGLGQSSSQAHPVPAAAAAHQQLPAPPELSPSACPPARPRTSSHPAQNLLPPKPHQSVFMDSMVLPCLLLFNNNNSTAIVFFLCGFFDVATPNYCSFLLDASRVVPENPCLPEWMCHSRSPKSPFAFLFCV